MKRTVFIVIVLVTFGYLIVGAVIFKFLEGTNESAKKRSFAADHEKFLQEHQCINHEELHAYVLRVLETHTEGVQVTNIVSRNYSGNVSSIDDEIFDTGTNWDISSSILFCITVISTIGYGNLSPKTWGGQMFCIFYALTGIPMFGAVLLAVGERLQIPVKKIRTGRPWIKNNPSRDAKLKSIVLLTSGISVLVFIPSLVFTLTQDWSYMESIYYSVITLTTIGFGDLVPGYFNKPERDSAKKNNVYRVLLAVWILLGLSWVALILSELGTFMQSKISTAAVTTQHRLSTLEGMVKKKAKETMERIIEKDKDREGKGTETPDEEDDEVTEVEYRSNSSDKERLDHKGDDCENAA
ncbi:two pore domain potassium channel number 2 [Aplysia californica]|uniref:Two pore domain potassium channel number 2 n=1 Tax=Aplysia californica TaxID=6500 RepID=A0ABM0ZY05_APLCA|nr:two pore domain potassium channel number 2 [Aplysia californica]